MKTAIGIALMAGTLFLGGCTLAPQPAAQGPAGQTGATGQPGQTGQAGQPGQMGDTGQKGQTGDQGTPAPCPPGQHRSTSDTGKVVCLPD